MQGQLGLNKKHPVISIETGDNDQNLKVYIGFKFYTIVPNNSKSLRYRLLVAELAAAGFFTDRVNENLWFQPSHHHEISGYHQKYP